MQIIAGDKVDIAMLKRCLHCFDNTNYSNKQVNDIKDLQETLSQLTYPLDFKNHLHLTYLGVLPLHLYLYLLDKLRINGFSEQDDIYIVLVSGTFSEFYDFFTKYMIKETKEQQLSLLNHMYNQWKNKNLDKLFPKHKIKKSNEFFWISK